MFPKQLVLIIFCLLMFACDKQHQSVENKIATASNMSDIFKLSKSYRVVL